MAGMTDIVAEVRERQESVIVAAVEIKAARDEVRGAAVDVRRAAEEFDMREFKLRQSYDKLDKAINSETQRRTAWQTLLDRLGTACLAVMLWALVQYVLTRFL